MTSLVGALVAALTLVCWATVLTRTSSPMPSSAVCSITDPLNSIKACVNASLAKIDAANGLTQRARRPQSAQLVSPVPRTLPPSSRPSTAGSAPTRNRSAHTISLRPSGATASTSRDLLEYARKRFEDATVADDREENENVLISAANSPTGLSSMSNQSHLTSKTRVSAYVTLTSSFAATDRSASLPTLPPDQKEQHELRLRLLNDIRVRAAKKPVKLQHDRVAQELCQEGARPSRTAVFPYKWPDTFRWLVKPTPKFEAARKAAQEQFESRMRAAADLPEPEEEEQKEEEKPLPPREVKSKR